MKKILIAMMVLLVASTAAIAETLKNSAVTPPLTGMSCLINMKNSVEPTTPTLRRSVITMTSPQGIKNEMVIGDAYKRLPDGKRMLLVTLQEPAALRGVSFLYIQKEFGELSIWIYSPAVRRTREISGTEFSQAYEPFLGTDFTISDIGLIVLPKTCQLAEKKESSGIPTYRVEEKVAVPNSSYSRIMSWIDADTFLPLQRNIFDQSGTLMKTLTLKKILNINRQSIPILAEMKNLKRNTTTTIEVTNIITDANIPNDYFDPHQLSKAADFTLIKALNPAQP